MRLLRYIGQFITSIGMNFALALFIGSLSVVFVFGSSQAIKDMLVESRTYDDAIATLLESVELTNDQSASGQSSIPLDDPELQSIIQDSLPPEFLQTQTEHVIDGVFAWLDGSTPQMNFMVDLTAPRTAFVSDVSQYAVKRVDALPTCGLADASAAPVDIFSLDCRPVGFSSAQAYSQILSDFNSGNFLSDTVITSADFVNEQGDSIESRFSYLPTVYGVLTNGVLISVSVLFIVSALYVWARHPIARGLKSLGRRLTSGGIIGLAFTLVFRFLLPTMLGGNTAGNGAQELFDRVVTVIVERVDTVALYGFSSIIAMGVLAAALGYIIEGSERHKLSALQGADQASAPQAQQSAVLDPNGYTTRK